MLLVVDDLAALVAWTDDMLRLAPRLVIDHDSEEEERGCATPFVVPAHTGVL